LCARNEYYGLFTYRNPDDRRNVWRRNGGFLDMKMPYNWVCPECKVEAGTISNTYPPTCNNPESHTSRVVEMVLLTNNKNTGE
jgi:rubredoxin